MKSIQLFMLAAITSVSAMASETADTVAVIDKPTSIAVINKENGKKIIVRGREGDPDYILEYESTVNDEGDSETEQLWVFNPRFARQSRNRKPTNPSVDAGCDIYAGAVIPTKADRGMSRTGWEIGMLNVAKAEWRLSRCGTRLSVGIGWQYRHFTIGDGLMASRGENGAYALSPIPSEYHDVKSSLKSFAIQFPVALSQKIYRKFTIELGGVAMLNTYTTGNCTWHVGDVTTKSPVKHLHQRLLTVDALARIGWREDFAFYVRYSPMAQFKAQYGPQFESIAIGASIGF
ncbi:MAG: hypothetical protein K2M77_07480 [Muribaculaceae bacterium]|nr:hypothetical protein [Muribaculaceae bacterium]